MRRIRSQSRSILQFVEVNPSVLTGETNPSVLPSALKLALTFVDQLNTFRSGCIAARRVHELIGELVIAI